MSKVVYLFGAGASFGKRNDNVSKDSLERIIEGIPIVKEIDDEMGIIIELIRNCQSTDSTEKYELMGNKCTFDEVKNKLVNDIVWLRDGASRHATIDTFAKKLIIKGEGKEYRMLKFLLCVFFLIEQMIHPYDKRYDTFLANILGLDASFPEDVYIITWNYDGQLGIAYQEYVMPNSCMVLPQKKVFRINGTANFTGNNNIEACTLPLMSNEQLLSKVLEQYVNFVNSAYSDGRFYLHFAWEQDYFNNQSAKLFSNIADTKVLVVIGYSFPFFNREIDREIFRRMEKLERIYIQDPRAKEIKEFLTSVLTDQLRNELLPNRVNILENKEEFFIPPEL